MSSSPRPCRNAPHTTEAARQPTSFSDTNARQTRDPTNWLCQQEFFHVSIELKLFEPLGTGTTTPSESKQHRIRLKRNRRNSIAESPRSREENGRSEEHTSELQSRPHLVC